MRSSSSQIRLSKINQKRVSSQIPERGKLNCSNLVARVIFSPTFKLFKGAIWLLKIKSRYVALGQVQGQKFANIGKEGQNFDQLQKKDPFYAGNLTSSCIGMIHYEVFFYLYSNSITCYLTIN